VYGRAILRFRNKPQFGFHVERPKFVPIVTKFGVFRLTHFIRIVGDRGSTVVKVLRYKSEGRWFDPSWCQWIFN